MRARTGVAAALLLAAFGLFPDVTRAADDPATLRALAARLANDTGSGSADVELTVGGIAQLPVPIALPTDVIVVGTVVRRPTGTVLYGMYRYTEFRVYVESPQPPEQLVSALVSVLAPAGYQRTKPRYWEPSGGFAVTGPEFITLCKNETSPAIVVRASRRDGRTEGVVTETVPSPDNPRSGGTACAQRFPAIENADSSPLPQIGAVDGVSISRRGATTGYGFSEQTVDVTTAMAPADVVTAWSKRITGDGWAPDGPPAASPTGAVATFRRTVDARARVVVLSLARVGRGRYLATIRNIAALEPSTAGTGR